MKTASRSPGSKSLMTSSETSAKNIIVDYQTDKIHYTPEALSKIRQGEEDYENGKGVKIAIQNLWDNL